MSVQSLFLDALSRIQHGKLTLQKPDQSLQIFEGKQPGPCATLTLDNWNVVENLMFRGDIGLAEDYVNGYCQTQNLPDLLKFAAQNAVVLERFFHGKPFHVLMYRLGHWLRANSLSGSRRNIESHYDLGNRFYKLWLDPSMTYSSALYHQNYSIALEAAQRQKYERILNQLKGPRQNCLEIGSGWGGFALQAAQADQHVVGLSLSPSQIKYCNTLIDQAQLTDHIQIKNQDYRHEHGQYDHIISIEMFEAVGQKYWPAYFNAIKRCLKPDGSAIIQVITIDDSVFQRYSKQCDFIQKYIFPGGFLPSHSRFVQSALQSELMVTDQFSFGEDYDHTLGVWLNQFDQSRDAVLSLGFDEHFIKKWRFYLAYCMAGFASGRTNVTQYTLRHAN